MPKYVSSEHSESPLSVIDFAILGMTIVLFYCWTFRLPSTYIFIPADQLIFLYNADRILQGDLMYVDFFQFTFPGNQLLFVGLMTIFGTKIWLYGLAAILIAGGAVWMCLRLSKMLILGPYAYIPTIIFSFFGLRWFGLDGSHSMLSFIFVMLAAWSLLKGRSYGHVILSAIFAAFASFITQQRGVVTVAAIMAFLFIDGYMSGGNWKAIFARVFLVPSIFITSLLILCSYYLFTAGPDTFINSTLIYPALYYHYFPFNNAGAYFYSLERIFSGSYSNLPPAFFYSAIVPLSVAAFFVAYWRKRSRHDWRFWRGPMVLGSIGAFSVLGTTNPTFSRYYFLSTIPLILLAWVIAYYDVFGKYAYKFVAGTACILILVGALQAYRIQTSSNNYLTFDTPRGQVAVPRAEMFECYFWLRDHTKPGDYVYQVDEPFVNYPLSLRNPTKYGQIIPYEYTRPEHVDSVIRDLEEKTPKYVLWNNNLNKESAPRPPGDHTGPLADYINSKYRPVSGACSAGQVWERMPR